MRSIANRSTREITGSRLKLADELVFTPQVHGQDIYYHVEVPSRAAFYRIGYSEYVFISLLDGKLTVTQALTVMARHLGAEALTQEEGVRVACWLIENGLADFADQEVSRSSVPVGRGDASRSFWQRCNPFWMKLSFGSPDRMLYVLAPLVSWCVSFWAILASLSVVAYGAFCLLGEWDRFCQSAASIIAPNNWLWLGLAWLMLKIVHELAHALACKYYGGEVRETGLVFILFAPMAYVDVTTCWRFPSKWQRIHVAVAGIYVELVLASAAAIVWTNVESPIIGHLLYNVIIMASISTFLFNANPLMKFDGYYILSDLLEIPNLAGEGERFVKQLSCRVFYGTPSRPFDMTGLRLWCVRAYGLANAAWRLLICFSMATAASVLMHGAGVVLAFVGLTLWFGRPAWNIARELERRYHEARASFVRAICVGCTMATVLTLALTHLPWPGAIAAPAIVEYADSAIVRSRSAGFVTRVLVEEGESVSKGQLLVELRNRDLEAERRDLELALEEGRVKRRIALEEHDAAMVQIAERNLEAVAERLDEAQRRTDGLSLLAPVDGRVLCRNLQQKVGSYVPEGSEILTIGDERRKELIISIGQEEIDDVVPLVGHDTRFRVHGRSTQRGCFERLDPRASTELPHPAMSSAVGGALAVREAEEAKQSTLRLASSRFRGVIALTPEVASELAAGQRGYAMLGLRSESIGEFAWVRFSQWLEALLVPKRS